jgi:hypothetical protein
MSEASIYVSGWRHDFIQDHEVDRAGVPFRPELFHDEIPAVITPEYAEALGSISIKHSVDISQLSPFHGRSYEIGRDEGPKLVFGDQYGNKYTSYTLKGNNFKKQDIIGSLTAPSGYIPFGLQEDDALLRILKASDLLRKNNIPTEWIHGVFEPKELLFDTELLDQATYKQRLLNKMLETTEPEEAAKIAKAIAPMTFFITSRAMETGHRISDFAYDETLDEVKNRLSKIYATYNITHRDDENFVPLSAESYEDNQRFFTQTFPRLRAESLAKLHQSGLVHKFPVLGNVTALGGIIDLDSVHGEPLGIGDKPITYDDVLNDLYIAFESFSFGPTIEIVMSSLRRFGLFYKDESEVTPATEISLISKSVWSFIEAYNQACGYKEDDLNSILTELWVTLGFHSDYLEFVSRGEKKHLADLFEYAVGDKLWGRTIKGLNLEYAPIVEECFKQSTTAQYIRAFDNSLQKIIEKDAKALIDVMEGELVDEFAAHAVVDLLIEAKDKAKDILLAKLVSNEILLSCRELIEELPGAKLHTKELQQTLVVLMCNYSAAGLANGAVDEDSSFQEAFAEYQKHIALVGPELTIPEPAEEDLTHTVSLYNGRIFMNHLATPLDTVLEVISAHSEEIEVIYFDEPAYYGADDIIQYFSDTKTTTTSEDLNNDEEDILNDRSVEYVGYKMPQDAAYEAALVKRRDTGKLELRIVTKEVMDAFNQNS